jgi:carbon monoxide dehydrogenase subunit G
MKYTTSIEIGLPREKVVQLVADPAHTPKCCAARTRPHSAPVEATGEP